jgi:hypothetical protein
MDCLETHRANLSQARQRLARAGDFGDAFMDGGMVIGAFASRLSNALHAALSQNALLRHVQNAELERGATDIWN